MLACSCFIARHFEVLIRARSASARSRCEITKAARSLPGAFVGERSAVAENLRIFPPVSDFRNFGSRLGTSRPRIKNSKWPYDLDTELSTDSLKAQVDSLTTGKPENHSNTSSKNKCTVIYLCSGVNRSEWSTYILTDLLLRSEIYCYLHRSIQKRFKLCDQC